MSDRILITHHSSLFSLEVPVPFHTHVLDNGLQIIGETSPSARSVALGFFVRTGSRDESREVSGVTHFLEHMVFKGTPRRTALEVNRDFDRIGASYNAFTSEENTVFHASVLPEYLPQAVDVLSDILRPSLRVEDFDMEKKVIIEEIGKYEDQPAWLAFDHARRLFFGGHRLGNSVLGTPGPPADSPPRHAASLLGVAVGDDTGSRLYWALVDPGLAESAGCGLDGNEGAGAYYTSFSGEPEQAEENLDIVHDVLTEV